MMCYRLCGKRLGKVSHVYDRPVVLWSGLCLDGTKTMTGWEVSCTRAMN